MILEIRSPIWSSMSVGIAARYLQGDGELDIAITYTNKDGNRSFPDKYYISKETAKQYPTQMAKGTKLYIIPIKELGVIEEEKDEALDFNFGKDLEDTVEETVDAVMGTLKYELLQKIQHLRNKARQRNQANG